MLLALVIVAMMSSFDKQDITVGALQLHTGEGHYVQASSNTMITLLSIWMAGQLRILHRKTILGSHIHNTLIEHSTKT